MNPIWGSCWEWTKGANDKGYGHVTIGVYQGASITINATLLAWFLYKKIDTPLTGQICHICNNRVCVNPQHLYHATASENMQYARICGRRDKKLDLSKAEQIRECYSLGAVSQRELAKKYGVCQTTIFEILQGKIWQEN